MKDRFAELVDKASEIEQLFHTVHFDPVPGLCFPEKSEQIHDVTQFKTWLEELKFELQDIVDRTGDTFAVSALEATNSGFNGWNDKNEFENLKNKVNVMMKNVDKYYRSEEKAVKQTEKIPKIFISHSSKDIRYVECIVALLDDMGLDQDNVFCSSLPGYGIPLDRNVFGYLREQFQLFDLHVIIVHSHNYYRSAVSLNEMGAAWVLKKHCTSFLLPGFEFGEMSGVVNSDNIAIKLDQSEDEVKDKVNQLYAMLIDEFGLKRKADIVWEKKRDTFISSVESISISEPQVEESLSGEAIKMLSIASQDEQGCIIKSITFLGTTIQAGETTMNTNSTQRESSKWLAALEELVDSEYIKQIDKKGELYQITDAGYRFIDGFEG